MKRRDVLDRKIAMELERARELTKAKNKRGALMALKKKKMYEQQREQLENQILRVGEQQLMLENQRTVVETVDAMRTAAHASKRVMTEMKIEDVDKVLDSINDQTEDMRQIQDALGAPIGAAGDVDEDELMEELEELEASQLDDQLLEPAPVPVTRVPVAPQRAQALPARPAPAAARVRGVCFLLEGTRVGEGAARRRVRALGQGCLVAASCAWPASVSGFACNPFLPLAPMPHSPPRKRRQRSWNWRSCKPSWPPERRACWV